jgi:hypothetical protein
MPPKIDSFCGFFLHAVVDSCYNNAIIIGLAMHRPNHTTESCLGIGVMREANSFRGFPLQKFVKIQPQFLKG